jgi:hypothetical protein
MNLSHKLLAPPTGPHNMSRVTNGYQLVKTLLKSLSGRAP